MIIRPAQPIATQTKASSDRRAIFVSLANESGEVDLLLAQRNERFGQLRTIYIDTSAQDDAGNGCVIETDIGQNITVLANTQGYYTVFVPFVSKLKISTNETATILLLDFDVTPNSWETVAQAGGIVPNPLHVIVDDQPIATNATIGNWPISQPITLDGQPIDADVIVQNWPTSQNVTVNNFITPNIYSTLTFNANGTQSTSGFNSIYSVNLVVVNVTCNASILFGFGVNNQAYQFHIPPTSAPYNVSVKFDYMNQPGNFQSTLIGGITGGFILFFVSGR